MCTTRRGNKEGFYYRPLSDPCCSERLLEVVELEWQVPRYTDWGPVARAREETSLSGSGSTYRGKRTVASVPTGDLAQRKEKPHVRGSHAAETVAQDAARSDDETLLEVGVPFATDCLVNPNDSAVGAARGFFSIIGGGGGLWTRKGVVRCRCGRLREKRTADCDGKSLRVTRSISSASKVARVFRTVTVDAGHVRAAGGRRERGKRNDVKVHVRSAVRPPVRNFWSSASLVLPTVWVVRIV
ncbi:hypothetical protein TNCT_150231 [Trichonephila clavata]|uniref:Uncharacterized protein n=1 Tax=Trichonephila clavata TaxID=2740835 RepID=A0A8X6KVG0_TRICU|nr:hypothetical protein TNCT_150231 [Trichonephila clavata]